MIAQREDFQQRQRVLRLLERGHVLQDSLGFTILGDYQRFTLLGEVCQNLGSVGLEVAYGFDWR